MRVALVVGNNQGQVLKKRLEGIKDNLNMDIYDDVPKYIDLSYKKNIIYDRVLVISKLLNPQTQSDLKVFWEEMSKDTQIVVMGRKGGDEEASKDFLQEFQSPVVAYMLVEKTTVALVAEAILSSTAELSKKYGIDNFMDVQTSDDGIVIPDGLIPGVEHKQPEVEKPASKQPPTNADTKKEKKGGLFGGLFGKKKDKGQVNQQNNQVQQPQNIQQNNMQNNMQNDMSQDYYDNSYQEQSGYDETQYTEQENGQTYDEFSENYSGNDENSQVTDDYETPNYPQYPQDDFEGTGILYGELPTPEAEEKPTDMQVLSEETNTEDLGNVDLNDVFNEEPLIQDDFGQTEEPAPRVAKRPPQPIREADMVQETPTPVQQLKPQVQQRPQQQVAQPTQTVRPQPQTAQPQPAQNVVQPQTPSMSRSGRPQFVDITNPKSQAVEEETFDLSESGGNDFDNDNITEVDEDFGMDTVDYSDPFGTNTPRRTAQVAEVDDDFSDMGVADAENAYRQANEQPKVVVREVVKEVVKDSGHGKINALKAVLTGKSHKVIIVTGDRATGITTTALNIAKRFSEKVPVLYYDCDTENHGLLSYINYDVFRDYENIQMQGVKLAKNHKAFNNCVCRYDNNFDILTTDYAYDVTDEEYELSASTVAEVVGDYGVIVVDCPVSKLHLIADLVMIGNTVVCVEGSKRGFMNMLNHLESSELPTRYKRAIVNKGYLFITKGNKNTDMKKLKKYITDIFVPSGADWMSMQATMFNGKVTDGLLNAILE